MFSFLKRSFLLLLGFALIAGFIWLAGPYFAFADYRPLESAFARLVAIGVVVLAWLGWRLVKRLRASLATDKLVAAVTRQVQSDEPAPPADVVKLREGFEQAVSKLNQQRRDRSLYDLPWYVIMGPPGSGKTTALLNSGLNFALDPSAKGRLRGVGGTRNCDWWFTDEAIFLDTAGRFTTQDSDATTDAAGWREFLALLSKYRKRRPINGVILTISARDLLTQGDFTRENQVEAARLRLAELTRELRIQLPVYVMVTMCDLVAGFTEYFDELTQEGRAQVWGVTFPYEQTLNGTAAQSFPREFEALVSRLNERLFERVEEQRDPRRRIRLFAFPQQVASLRDALAQFVADVFASRERDSQILLRGVYLTSGTQEGTPIDRLLASIGRDFGVAPEAVAPAGRGKAYFVERLLKEVLIGESGLAGVNRRVEMQKAVAQLGSYAAMALAAIVGVLMMSISYGRNSSYVSDISGEVAKLGAMPAAQTGSSVDVLLPRLDAVRTVVDTANRHNDDIPWSMRWGLYQGRSIGNSARDAYIRELDGSLLPFVAGRIRQRVIQSANDPERLYEYLKAYLMLGQPEHLDAKHLQFLANLEWSRETGVGAEAGESLSKHFQSLIERGNTLRPMALDAALVAQARNTIRQASVPRIMYAWLKDTYANDERAVRLDVVGGVAADQVFRRKSGASMAEPVPALYSRPVFNEVTGKDLGELVRRFSDDRWVWGDRGPDTGDRGKLGAELTAIYERDYVSAWDGILDDLQLVSFSNMAQTTTALGLLAGPTSPLRGILQIVVDNTTLIRSPDPSTTTGKVAAAGKSVTDRLSKLFPPAITGGPGVQPGTVVTAHFQPVHLIMAGDPGMAPIDQVLAKIGQIHQQLQTLGPDVGRADPLEALSSPALRGVLQALRQDAATLPPAVEALIAQIGQNAEGSVVTDATRDLDNRYQQQVLSECVAMVEGRYPFVPTSSQDVQLSDFGRLFGHGGIFDTFFTANLATLVDTSQSSWTWRPGATSSSRDMLRQVEAAHRIREAFFPAGSNAPDVRFTAMLENLDRSARRFVLQVDGQNADDRQGPQRRWPFKWPASDPGTAAATFEDRSGAWPTQSFGGPWAFFRLLDLGQMQRETPLRAALNFQQGNYRTRVLIEASSIRNPFTDREWQRFSCGASRATT